MSTQSNVAALKEQFEQLFPGKWLLKENNQRHLQTGLAGIDLGPSRGVARKRISEWAGSASSGKSTVLRAVIANWCAVGMHVVYIDANNKLIPADWAFVEQGICGNMPLNMVRPRSNHNLRTLSLIEPVNTGGRFWVVRNLNNITINKGQKQNALWATEQLVRSNLFDVVIFDATDSPPLSSRFYARLQRSLDSSKAALLIVKDEESATSSQSTWGCHTRFNFGWANPVSIQYGLNGIAALTPAISSSVWKDGMTNSLEVAFNAYATNRLFTHTQVPDRRVPKARTKLKK